MPPRSIPQNIQSSTSYSDEATSSIRRADSANVTDSLDSAMGFDRFDAGPSRVGWLVNFQPTTIESAASSNGANAVDFYFIDEEGGYFKSTLQMDPYFLVKCIPGTEGDVEEWLKKSLDGTVKDIKRIEKEDLALPNHLTGTVQPLIELRFLNVTDLMAARKVLSPLAVQNQKKLEAFGGHSNVKQNNSAKEVTRADPSTYIIDIREQDVPYHVRVAIDMNIRVGKWYKIDAVEGTVTFTELPDRIARADPVVMAFDIETCKAPLKFPDSSIDPIMMISYMIDGVGYLITNREVVSKDIDDFEYTPKPEFSGLFTVFNEPNEKELLLRFIEHIREEKPTVIVTYNGDFFDWPYVDARCAIHDISLYQRTGFRPDSEGEYKSTHASHMDALRWVKRDSYLPQGSQGLKPVTKAKLGYNPLEISPELMTPYARDRPQVLAEYSVSDAVATYYLYMKYVHPFIFSLCNILPLRPDEVLRKGTGTLCEMLLMVQAYDRNILLPHKHSDPLERFYNGHLVESETYVGGHVESLEAGVFRHDIPTDFKIDTEAIDQLLAQLDDALKFTITKEHNMAVSDCTNYEEIKQEITQKLLDLKARPSRKETPLIYHVDVASMYPNIMTTNRLQPDSMKSEKDCAMCDFNRHGKVCDRRLPWAWRGEFYPPKKDEYLMIQNQLKRERFPATSANNPGNTTSKSNSNGVARTRAWEELSQTEMAARTKQRISDYSRKVYHKLRESETVEREAIICQRENPFYVNTVRDFRDRRYEFKGLQKTWKRKLEEISKTDVASREEAAKMIVLYDSLQLAHKCILNSFYGYVMRKGSRWYSMEMAGVTCLMGATIIQLARSLVERLGRPLELDTDGIWCILPSSFPGDLSFKYSNGKRGAFAYPCTMLNHLVHEKFTNHQYQTLVDPETFKYEVSSDNSIFFEVDGPYRAMMLPSSREEGKGLKKRYAVFNFDGSLAELKGFEIKRRGELQLIKSFQDQVFWRFLEGKTLEECYASVAECANAWIDVLDSAGSNLEDQDLMGLISENKSMSKSLEEYGNQKSTSICTARRLCEFLGPQMVKDRGLNCQYIISSEPSNEPVTNRAVPIAIFDAEPSVKCYFLRKWLKRPGLDNFDPRTIIDWAYYRERLEATIQKIVTIPAARQGIANPVPRVIPPAWLTRRLAEANDKMKQQKIGFIAVTREAHLEKIFDIEDATGDASQQMVGKAAAVVKRRRSDRNTSEAVAGSLTDAEALAVPDETPETAPDPFVNYGAWIMYMKKVWAKRRVQRENRRRIFGARAAPKYSRGIQGLIRNQLQHAFQGGLWHILQISRGSVAGQVKATVLINGNVQVVQVNVPRRIFIEFRREVNISDIVTKEIELEHSDWTLPSGRTARGRLLMATMSEQTYQDELFKADGFLKQADVCNIYEQELSSVDRVIVELGSQAVLDDAPGLLGRGLSSGFDLSWLKPYQEKKQPVEYLSDGINLEYVQVQHFEVHGRHICVVLGSNCPATQVVQYSQVPLENWSLSADYDSQYSSLHPSEPLFQLQVKLDVEVHTVSDLKKFYSKIASVLSETHSSNHPIAVVQSNRPVRRLLSRIRQLNDHHIVISSPSAIGSLPAIGWQPTLSKKIVKNILRLQYWLVDLKKMARYTQVPLANLPSDDDMRPIIDILYARRLRQAKHILWWNPLGSPADLAGNSSSLEIDQVGNKDLSFTSVNNSGLYGNVCLDVSISNLAVNTVLTASLLTSAEGTEDAGAPDALVLDAFSGLAWRILSQLIKEWWNQAASSDETADQLIEQFGGWVASASARLYSSRLAYHVSNISSKALSQLVGEFKRTQLSVVASSRSRMLLSSTKWQVENTFPFGSYMIKNIKSNPLFTYLDINITDFWDYLVWLDDTNYSGRVWKEMTAENKPVFTHVSSWQLADFLSPLLRSEFDEWVYQLMHAVSDAKDRFFVANGERPTQVVARGQSGSDEESLVNFTSSAIKYLENPLVNRVRQLNNRYIDSKSNPGSDIAAEFEAPSRAGLKARPGNPVLAFVKSICAVYGLDSGSESEYLRLRKRLLEILKVGEFDPAANYHSPNARLVVSNVICGSCHDCIDVDVCRPENDTVFSFICPRCGHELDRVFLEERMVQQLVGIAWQYQLQDLVCSKCGKVRPDNLSMYCECSGEWKTTDSANKVQQTARVFKQIAEHFNLRLLQSANEALAF